MLAFPPGVKPFKKGLPFYAKLIKEADTVVSAGFPNMGGDTSWRLSQGIVSNIGFRIRPDQQTNVTTGPYILHQAAVDPGNSGGPLLIADPRSPARYSVVGVNVMKINNVSGGNLAIPLDKTTAFVQASLEKSKLSDEQQLSQQVNGFVTTLNELAVSLDVEGLMGYLSLTMVNANPIEALTSLMSNQETQTAAAWGLMKEPLTTVRTAVTYDKIIKPVIEILTGTRTSSLKVESLFTEPNNFGGYTVMMLINSVPLRTEWVKEYNTWHLYDFVRDDGELNDVQLYATRHPLGIPVTYSFMSKQDVDWYYIVVPAAKTLKVFTGGSMDTEIELSDDTLKILAKDNDSGQGDNASISVGVKPGTYYLKVKQDAKYAKTGAYTLTAQLE